MSDHSVKKNSQLSKVNPATKAPAKKPIAPKVIPNAPVATKPTGTKAVAAKTTVASTTKPAKATPAKPAVKKVSPTAQVNNKPLASKTPTAASTPSTTKTSAIRKSSAQKVIKAKTTTLPNNLEVAKPNESVNVNKVAKSASKNPAPLKKEGKKTKSNEKIKMVRDSFTMPKDEYAEITSLKSKMINLGRPVKKSELLRAGIMLLTQLSEVALKTTMEKVPVIKTGRPKNK
jgi:hypothetical protein